MFWLNSQIFWNSATHISLLKVINVRKKKFFSIWNPYTKREINILEKVQERATKLVPSVRHLRYEDRLKAIGLTTLKERRSRADLIEFYKIKTGLSEVSWHNPNRSGGFTDGEGPASGLRGSRFRIARQLTRNQHRHNFLPNRIVNLWNSLPESVVESKSKNDFKKNVDNFSKLKELIK